MTVRPDKLWVCWSTEAEASSAFRHSHTLQVQSPDAALRPGLQQDTGSHGASLSFSERSRLCNSCSRRREISEPVLELSRNLAEQIE